MAATTVGFHFNPSRRYFVRGRANAGLAFAGLAALILCGSRLAFSQAATPAAAEPVPAPISPPVGGSGPIAFVPLDNNPEVKGAIEVFSGKAVLGKSGTVTSSAKTTEVILPHRGLLRVCASTSVHLSSDASVPAGETPGLMMALDHGAVEASFATGQNSDILLTPDFRILIGGPGSAEVKVRLGQHGDTCVDNAGPNAPYVVVSSVFEGGAYRVQPGQRVMFQHGSLSEVVDQEKEPCGCPPDVRPGTNDFPLAQSAGLAPLEKPVPASPPPPTTAPAPQPQQPLNEPLVYTAAPSTPEPEPAKPIQATPAAPSAAPAPAPVSPPANKKPGFFRKVGHFFRKIFGGE